MKKTIYIISLIALCLTFSGCKKLVKSVGKETGQDVLAKTSKDALGQRKSYGDTMNKSITFAT